MVHPWVICVSVLEGCVRDVRTLDIVIGRYQLERMTHFIAEDSMLKAWQNVIGWYATEVRLRECFQPRSALCVRLP